MRRLKIWKMRRPNRRRWRHRRRRLCPCQSMVSNWNLITFSRKNVHKICGHLCGKHCHWYHWRGGELMLEFGVYFHFSFFVWFRSSRETILLCCFRFVVMRLGSAGFSFSVYVTYPTRDQRRSDRQVARRDRNAIDKMHVATDGRNCFFLSFIYQFQLSSGTHHRRNRVHECPMTRFLSPER